MLNDKKTNSEEEIINIITDVTNLKSSLVDFLLKQHGKFANHENDIKELAEKFDGVHTRALSVIQESEKTCSELYSSIEDRDKYMRQVDSLQTLRAAVVNLMEIDKSIIKLQALVGPQLDISLENIGAIKNELINVKEVLNRSSSIFRTQDIQVYKTLIRNYCEIKSELKDNLMELWHSKVVIIEHNDKNPYFNYDDPINNDGLIPTSKSVSFDLDTTLLRLTISLMYQMENGPQNLMLLLQFISAELIYPCIEDFEGFSLCSTIINSKLSITMNAKKRATSSASSSSLADRALEFLDSLTDTLKTVYEHILEAVEDHRLIVDVQRTFFDQQLTESLQTHFLPLIFDSRHLLTERLYRFNDFLLQYRYIHSSNRSLREYVDNFDLHARNFEETSLLGNFRRLCLDSLLKYELTNGSGTNGGGVALKREDVRALSAELPSVSKYIDLEALCFPLCHISLIVSNMMSSVIGSIEEYDLHSTMETGEVIEFLRLLPNAVMMYLSVVPISNSKELENIPQAAAIHYNNCMYIAHHCMFLSPNIKSLADNYISRTPLCDPIDKIICTNAPTSLLRLVYIMQSAASETLTVECNKQKEQLDELIAEIDTFSGIGTSEQKKRIEKVFDRCYFFLLSLSEAYFVLPQRIYDKFFGGILLNHLLMLLIKKVLKMSDIVQTDVSEMVLIIKQLSNRLFDIIHKHFITRLSCEISERSYMLEHVPNWDRVNSLLFIIEGSLIGIEERYADGKGPLAEHFSGAELKSLIKALFRHSQLRTKVLENIK